MDTRTFPRSHAQVSQENQTLRIQIALAALHLARMVVALVSEETTPTSGNEAVAPEARTVRPPSPHAPVEWLDLEIDLDEPTDSR